MTRVVKLPSSLFQRKLSFFSHQDHSVCLLHNEATVLDGYYRIYGLSIDQICPSEVVCWFSHGVRHLEFVSPEEYWVRIQKEIGGRN